MTVTLRFGERRPEPEDCPHANVTLDLRGVTCQDCGQRVERGLRTEAQRREARNRSRKRRAG